MVDQKYVLNIVWVIRVLMSSGKQVSTMSVGCNRVLK